MGGYVLTRALPGGFLGDHGDVGNWRCPLGITALSVETLVILLVLARRLAGLGPRREPRRGVPGLPIGARPSTVGPDDQEYQDAHVLAWPARPRRRGPVAAVGVPGCYRRRPGDTGGRATRCAAQGMALSYTTFLADVSAGMVRAVTISPAGQGSPAAWPADTRLPPPSRSLSAGNGLAGALAAHHVQVTATTANVLLAAGTADRAAAAACCLAACSISHPQGSPVVRRRPRRLGGLAKARARVHRRRTAGHPVHRRPPGTPTVKTEISEVVDYLRDPGRYHQAGRAGRAAC